MPFAGLQVNPGFSFSAGVPGAFLQNSGPQPNSASSQGPGGKPSHIPYSQQRPSAPGPAPGPGGPGQQPAPQQLQVQTLPLQQQQQSPTKPVQMGKSPPHIPGMQQVWLVPFVLLLTNSHTHTYLVSHAHAYAHTYTHRHTL